MRPATKIDDLEIYVWEGKADIVEQVVHCMSSFEVDVIRADGMSIAAGHDAQRAGRARPRLRQA